MTRNPCKTVIHGDTTECRVCGLRWDTNDPSPPTCKFVEADRIIERERRQRQQFERWQWIILALCIGIVIGRYAERFGL